MPALKLDMTIPLGDAGHIALAIDVTDLGQLTDRQRGGIADTLREFSDFAAATLAPMAVVVPAAAVHDPHADVLRGVTGTRRNTS